MAQNPKEWCFAVTVVFDEPCHRKTARKRLQNIIDVAQPSIHLGIKKIKVENCTIGKV